jgi:urease accessory protein
MMSDSAALMRLLQLVSPTLPVGAFSYSQGLEWAIECGWVKDVGSFESWLEGLMYDNLEKLDIPVLKRLYLACEQRDKQALIDWSEYLLAARETSELSLEEQNRARTLTTLLVNLEMTQAREWQECLNTCQIASFALAANGWKINLKDAALGYVWSWLENQVAAAIKLIPLGQTDGQRIQLNLTQTLTEIVENGLQLEDKDIGASAPALAIASSLHETQYTRLFRS